VRDRLEGPSLTADMARHLSKRVMILEREIAELERV